MLEDGAWRIADRQILPQPEDGDRPGFAGNGLDLPGAGELPLGGGQDFVLLAQAGQVGRGEGVVDGRGGTLVTSRELRMRSSPLRGQGGGSSSSSGRPRLNEFEDAPPNAGRVAQVGRNGRAKIAFFRQKANSLHAELRRASGFAAALSLARYETARDRILGTLRS
jgi:hypothetical protein